ncbi:MAG: hypothetical protein Q9226_009022, partial [Calogaya cf. arnoldii]
PVETHSSGSVIEIATTSNSSFAYLSENTRSDLETTARKHVVIARLAETTLLKPPPAHQTVLEALGWTITQETHPGSKIADDAVVLVLDELWNLVLTQANEKQWEAIKALVGSGKSLFWVTRGAQYPVTHPDNAMIHGPFRVARQEDSTARLTTLDVQSSTSPATA